MSLGLRRGCSLDLGQTNARNAPMRHAGGRRLLKFVAIERMVDGARRSRGVRASR
jgi:hypothetical protein